MSDPITPPADAVARLTAQMLDPWERVRCLPRCRSDEPMNHGECDCGSQQFVSDLRTLLAAYADAARDRERMREAIEWALGYTDFRPRNEGEGPYWWRYELRERAGFVSDAARTGEAR